MSSNTDTVERFAQLVDLESAPVFLDGGDPRMRPAVTIAAALRNAGTVSAPPPLSDTARLAMRERLVAAAAATSGADAASEGVAARVNRAAEAGQRRAKDAGRKISRRMTTLVGSVVLVTSVAGVGVAAARSLPGSPFYDLKRATEAIELWATSGDAARGQRHLEFARTRMAEAAALPPNSPYLASTLNAMNEETRQANSDLLQAYKSSGSAQPLADLVSFAHQQYARLARLGASLPTSLHAEATYSASLLTGVSQEVQSVTKGLCPQCVPSGQPSNAPGPVLAPTPAPSAHSSHPATTPAVSPSVRSSTPPSSDRPSTDRPHLLPTLPPLLHRPSGKQNNQPNPLLSPLPLISSLAQLLGK